MPCPGCLPEQGHIRIIILSDKQEFITDIQDRFNKIKATEGIVSKDSTASLIREAHLHLYHHYPVYYDWWLQDGSDIKWFDRSLPEQISERLHKLQQETKVTDTPESITQAISSYLDCLPGTKGTTVGFLCKKHARSGVYQVPYLTPIFLRLYGRFVGCPRRMQFLCRG